MLQQTQTERVVPKYREFLKRFPTVRALARAPLGEVLRAWQGLGYNRRARMLHQCAQMVVEEYCGVFPRTYDELVRLPGIGPYTAGAVMAFAFNDAVPIIETNIRTVYLHHFFQDRQAVHDREVLEYIAATLDRHNPREWYAALMDYGAYLKESIGNLNTRSRHYTRQSAFKGSDRQIRGAILRLLAGREQAGKATILRAITKELAVPNERVSVQLAALVAESLLVRNAHTYRLAV